MNVTTMDSLRMTGWLMNGNLPGGRAAPLRLMIVVFVVLSLVLTRERTAFLGYTMPRLETPAFFAVWVPLLLSFLMVNGLAQVRKAPSMGMLPALLAKFRRASVVLSLGTAVLAGGVSGLYGISPLAGMSVAIFSYGLGSSSHFIARRRLDAQPARLVRRCLGCGGRRPPVAPLLRPLLPRDPARSRSLSGCRAHEPLDSPRDEARPRPLRRSS